VSIFATILIVIFKYIRLDTFGDDKTSTPLNNS
jgi:hypothetical protein